MNRDCVSEGGFMAVAKTLSPLLSGVSVGNLNQNVRGGVVAALSSFSEISSPSFPLPIRADSEIVASGPFKSFNMVWCLDVSASMDTLHGEISRLEIAKTALLSLADQYTLYGREAREAHDPVEIIIHVIPFSSGLRPAATFTFQEVKGYWGFFDHLTEIHDYLNALQAEGGTYYDLALREALDYFRHTTFATDHRLHYFISDGSPVHGHEGPERIGEEFESLKISSLAIGLFNPSSLEYLAHIDNTSGGEVIHSPEELRVFLDFMSGISGIDFGRGEKVIPDRNASDDITRMESAEIVALFSEEREDNSVFYEMNLIQSDEKITLFPHASPTDAFEVFEIQLPVLPNEIETVQHFNILEDLVDLTEILSRAGYDEGEKIEDYVDISPGGSQTLLLSVDLHDGAGFIPVAQLTGVSGGVLHILTGAEGLVEMLV